MKQPPNSRIVPLLIFLGMAAASAVGFYAGRYSKRDIWIKVDCASPAAARERMHTPFVPPELFGTPPGGLSL